MLPSIEEVRRAIEFFNNKTEIYNLGDEKECIAILTSIAQLYLNNIEWLIDVIGDFEKGYYEEVGNNLPIVGLAKHIIQATLERKG